MAIFYQLVSWLNPIIHAVGFCVAVWAFRKCRKTGYLIIAAFFALAVYSLVATPRINKAMAAHRKPEISVETEKRLNDAIHEVTQRILGEAGHPTIAHTVSFNFPLGPILLVTGLWLVAKREDTAPNCHAGTDPSG